MTPQLEPMKDWQHGIPLHELKLIEKDYETFNRFAHSPFSTVKKNTIATMIHEATLRTLYKDNIKVGHINSAIAKASTDIEMFPGVVIGRKLKGDVVFSNLTVASNNYVECLASLKECRYENRDTWFYIWEEDNFSKHVMEKLGFRKVGTKVTTFSDMYGIYFKDKVNKLVPSKRVHPVISHYEFCTLNPLDIPTQNVKKIAKQLEAINWVNHYSNSNKQNNWGAIALQGYSKDPVLIEKPSCMSPKWQEAHKNDTFKLQHTTLWPQFKDLVQPLLDLLPGEKDRIRFMRLRANNENNSELTRHTDLVEAEAGLADGKIIRVHLPIITNRDVAFSCWNMGGVEDMLTPPPVGKFFILDIRKPHRVVNGGAIDRIHLVIDVYSNEKLRDLIV